jgi:hypothetical protein
MLYRPSLEKHFSLRQAAVTLCDSFEKQKVKRKLPILLNQIMEIFKSTNYFLKDFKEIFSTGILGKEGGFEKFLNDKKINNSGENWDEDHSQVDWKKIEKHYQFFFDYVDNEIEISDWLKESKLSQYEFVFTWLSWEDPIIRVKTTEFIENWNNVYMASVEGMVLTTSDGKLVLEFTDDYKYNLNSNFEIKQNSLKKTD